MTKDQLERLWTWAASHDREFNRNAAFELLAEVERLEKSLDEKGRLTFAEVSKLNQERSALWHDTPEKQWTVTDLATATVGEFGELCNVIKKLRRLACGMQQNANSMTEAEMLAMCKKELGDTFLYLDLLAQKLGIRMDEAVSEAFNQVSEREGFPQRL